MAPPIRAALDTILSGLEAAGEPTRLRLLALLCEADLTVSELVTILGQSQPRISRHLKLLVDAGLAERHRLGHRIDGNRRIDSAAHEIARGL